MIRIRPAQPGDIPWLAAQLKVFSVFFGSKRPLFPDGDYALRGMQDMIDKHVVLVAENDAGLVGFISGWITPHPFNPSIRTLVETFWWVAEEHRGSRAGLMLLNAFTEWGKANADWILFTLETQSPVKDDILLKRGFKLKERNFLMEVV